MKLNKFIPAWDWFVGTKRGKNLLRKNKGKEILIQESFYTGFNVFLLVNKDSKDTLMTFINWRETKPCGCGGKMILSGIQEFGAHRGIRKDGEPPRFIKIFTCNKCELKESERWEK